MMYTDHQISPDEHRAWIKGLAGDDRRVVLAVFDADKEGPLGIVSFTAIDRRHRKTDWAFYLTANARGSGIGVALEIAAIDFAFGQLGMEKLNCEVIETNTAVIAFHKRFGFEEEGFRKSNLLKKGERIGVVFLGLQNAFWKERRDDVLSRVPRIPPVRIAWDPPSDGDGPHPPRS